MHIFLTLYNNLYNEEILTIFVKLNVDVGYFGARLGSLILLANCSLIEFLHFLSKFCRKQINIFILDDIGDVSSKATNNRKPLVNAAR